MTEERKKGISRGKNRRYYAAHREEEKKRTAEYLRLNPRVLEGEELRKERERTRLWHRSHPRTKEQKERRNMLRRLRLKSHPPTEDQRQKKRETDRISRMRQTPEQKSRKLEYSRRLKKRMLREDPVFAAVHCARTRIAQALRVQKAYKNGSSYALIGCLPKKLKEHIESLFLPGMTWANRGQWHIDHIRPCASFDLTDSNQQRCCFHYTNLQPLWALDNLKKSAKTVETQSHVN